MIKFNTLREAAQFRITESEDNYWVEDYWKAAIEMYVKDISATIMFFQNDCDDEELYFLSEIFEEIVEQTQSRELVSVLHSRLAKITPENYEQQAFKSKYMRRWVDYNEYVKVIEEEINYAENKIDE